MNNENLETEIRKASIGLEALYSTGRYNTDPDNVKLSATQRALLTELIRTDISTYTNDYNNKNAGIEVAKLFQFLKNECTIKFFNTFPRKLRDREDLIIMLKHARTNPASLLWDTIKEAVSENIIPIIWGIVVGIVMVAFVEVIVVDDKDTNIPNTVPTIELYSPSNTTQEWSWD